MKKNLEYVKKAYKKIAIASIILFIMIVSICIKTEVFIHKDKNVESKEAKTADSEDTEEGIYIPAIRLPTDDIVADADMLPLIVYNGSVYTCNAAFDCDEEMKKSLLGEYLGWASGTISAESNIDEYEKEFASTTTGEVYSVNGYDKEFRICIPKTHEGLNYIEFYDKINDINLTTGKDLYGDRLFLKDNYQEALYQSYSDYVNVEDDFSMCTVLNQSDSDELIEALYQSPFVKLTHEEDSENIPDFDTERDQIVQLYFKMKDKTIVEITLFESGYVYYGNVFSVYIYIEDDIVDKIFQEIASK